MLIFRDSGLYSPRPSNPTPMNAAPSIMFCRYKTEICEIAYIQWSGVEWSGVEWSGVEWSGVEWSGVEWSGVEWSGVEWSGVE